jgi:hypothetical protein
MFSIYQDSAVFGAKLAMAQPSDLAKKKPIKRYLTFARFFLVNAAKTCKAILEGRLTQLDPIVGENSCQIRALAAIKAISDNTLREEVKQLKKQCETHLARVQKTLQNPPELADFNTRSIGQVMDDLQLSLSTSALMRLLLKAHLLTLGKFFKVLPNGREISGIDIAILRRQLSPGLPREVVREIVCRERINMANLSVPFLQEQAAALPDSHLQTLVASRTIRQVPLQIFTSKKHPTKKKIENIHLRVALSCSCALFNLRVILAQLCQQQVPILLKEYRTDGEASLGYYFRSPTSGEAPRLLAAAPQKKEEPIFVFECRFSTLAELPQAIEKEGLVEIALANAAKVAQYAVDDAVDHLNGEEQQEIARYKVLGEKLGCQTSAPALFSIVHTHAATVQEELLR